MIRLLEQQVIHGILPEIQTLEFVNSIWLFQNNVLAWASGKDTKQIPSCQMVSYTFFKFIAIFIFIGIQTTLFGHSNEQNPVCHFTYISVPSHCSHL